MVDPRLEMALSYAGSAGDIGSLKSLARTENTRAQRFAQLLGAVLAATGPVRIHDVTVAPQSGRITITPDGDGWIMLSAAH